MVIRWNDDELKHFFSGLSPHKSLEEESTARVRMTGNKNP